MTREQIYDLWAPPGATWSAWVKPVLFASLPSVMPNEPAEPVGVESTAWAPLASERTVVVLDLPGAEGVMLGIALAERGYQPVPVYNAHPGSGNLFAAQDVPVALVDVRPIARALVAGCDRLRNAARPAIGPPAFLLDANRRLGSGPRSPGRFDNRSVSFPTDFPSANLLLNQRIARVLLVQRGGIVPQQDLAHTLRKWKEAGIEIAAIDLDVPTIIRPCNVGRASRIAAWWHYLTAAMGFRAHPLGGFGGMIPEPSAG